jgi:predicted Zn-dependent protease
MKKAFIGLLLLAIIFVSFAFVVLKLLANGSEDNFFNQKYRAKFAAQPTLRKMLNLHYDGDGRADLLGDRYSKIVIEVDEMLDLDLPSDALDIFEEKVAAVTGKEVIVVRSDKVPYKDSVTLEEVNELTNVYRNYIYTKDAARFYVLYLSQFAGELSTDIGATNQEFGILLFDTTLQGLTAGNPDTLVKYIASTLLHEFGHQIGLDHNEETNCLMNASVEEGDVLREGSGDVLIDFCSYEKELIQTLK